jgi:hypothetical protein
MKTADKVKLLLQFNKQYERLKTEKEKRELALHFWDSIEQQRDYEETVK